jgi:hypothetical protein
LGPGVAMRVLSPRFSAVRSPIPRPRWQLRSRHHAICPLGDICFSIAPGMRIQPAQPSGKSWRRDGNPAEHLVKRWVQQEEP